MMRRRFAGHLGLRGPDQPLFVASARSADPQDQIAFMAAQGLAGVFDNGLAARDPAEQVAIGAAAARHGLAFGSIALDPHGWLTPLWSRPDAQDSQTAVIDRAIAAIDRVGGGTATIVTGYAEDMPRAAQMAAVSENLRRIADRAAKGGLTLCVEPVPGCFIPGLLVERLDEARAIVAAVDHPHVRLAYDVAHVGMAGDDPVGGIAAVSDIIGLVQIADLPGRVELGAGTLDWHSVFSALDLAGWRGLLEIEHLPSSAGKTGDAALLAWLRTADDMGEGD